MVDLQCIVTEEDIPCNLELVQEKSVLGAKTGFSEKCREKRTHSKLGQ